MELGGNLNATKHYETNKLFTNGQHDFTLPLAAKYRQELNKLAENSVPAKKTIVSEDARIEPEIKNTDDAILSKQEKAKSSEKEELSDGSKMVIVKYYYY